MSRAFDMQKKVLKSLKSEFEVAARRVHQDTLEEITRLLDTKSDDTAIRKILWNSRNVCFRPFDEKAYDILRARKRITELQQGANEGRYLLGSLRARGSGYELWYHYLESLNRLKQGFGCIPGNAALMEKLIRQNGPKKMEERLRRFAKKEISETYRKKRFG